MHVNTALIVEDDPELLDVLKYNFAKEGFNVATAIDGLQALEIARRIKPDLIILDLMLPEIYGFEVCRILRQEMTTPIIVLTAKHEEVDKVVCLQLGADDYMTKPFSMKELLVRAQSILRRARLNRHEAASSKEKESVQSKNGFLQVDLVGHRVFLNGSLVKLRPKEFDLLAFLLKNQGKVFSRSHLLEKIWGYDYSGDTRTIDVHIRYLRQKIVLIPGSLNI